MAFSDKNAWRSSAFRNIIIERIEEETNQKSGMLASKSSVEKENDIYQKANSKAEYLNNVAKLILHIREINSNKKAQVNNLPVQDPINALLGIGNDIKITSCHPDIKPTTHILYGDHKIWRTSAFRLHIVQKIEQNMQKSGMPTSISSMAMENHVYQRSNTMDEYMTHVGILLLRIRERNQNNSTEVDINQLMQNLDI